MHRSKKQLFDHLVGTAEHIGSHHHHIQDSGATQSADATGSDPAGATTDPLLQALAGASSTSVSNTDGSTTTQSPRLKGNAGDAGRRSLSRVIGVESRRTSSSHLARGAGALRHSAAVGQRVTFRICPLEKENPHRACAAG
jgi:hypothetical protein